MNKSRRTRLGKAIALIDEAQQIIADIAAEEIKSRDSIPESLQDGERYERLEEAIDALDNAEGYTQDALDEIHRAICE